MSFLQRRVFGLVPARGGSKGVPRKNLRILKGQPLVVHTLIAAAQSSVIDEVYLSSDDPEILKIGSDFGVETIQRSPELASDTASATQVVVDFIQKLPKNKLDNDPFIVYLQPTSPLRTSRHIDQAFLEMTSKNASQCMSVIPLKKSPFKSFKISEKGLLESIFGEELSNANRQSLPQTYYPNGAIYIFPISEYYRAHGFPSNGSVPFVMTENESIDIDTEEDLAQVEKL